MNGPNNHREDRSWLLKLPGVSCRLAWIAIPCLVVLLNLSWTATDVTGRPFSVPKPVPQDETVYSSGSGVSEPIAVQSVQPSYTPEAREAGVQGTLKLQAVVGTDGSVSKIQIVKSLGYGLDEAAAKALSQWRFKPGTKDGKPVRVMIEVSMNFSMR